MEKFKKDLAFLCFSAGVSLQDLKECVESWDVQNEGQEGVKPDSPYINLEDSVEGFKYICTVEGKDYYLLAGECRNGVDWYSAKKYAGSMGSGWDLPCNKVLGQMYLDRDSLGIKEYERLWSKEEHSASKVWHQNFECTIPLLCNKTMTFGMSVRPVYAVDTFKW